MKKFSLIVISALFLSSCVLDGQNVSQLDYLKRGAEFDVKKFFDGDVDGFAIVQDANGKILDTKSIKIEGSWEEEKGVIKKVFTSSRGKKDSRTWLITMDQGGSFTAIGHDIAAPAQGEQAGNAMRMIYSLLLPGNIKGQKEAVNFEDKIYAVTADSAIMISTSRTGLGEVEKTTISLKKSSVEAVTNAPTKVLKPSAVKKEVKSFNVTSPSDKDEVSSKKESK
jgi:hypothetical protein